MVARPFNCRAMKLAQMLQSAVAMFHRLIQSISILLLLTATTIAQVRRETGPSLQERSRELEPLMIESAKRYGIDPRILQTVCFIESRYRLNAISPKGALGPMQFMPETAQRYGLGNPHDAKSSIDAAAHYLSDLLRKFGGRVDLALAAYNAGEGTVQSFQTGRPLVLPSGKIINRLRLITGGVPPYPETQQYVKSAIAILTNNRFTNATSDSPQGSGSVLRFSDRNRPLDSAPDSRRSASVLNQKSGSSFIEVEW
ncbi:MAG: transglycosylase SLT domain-containing protein [Acidobacteriota bacterium]|nr:transglycosylase SLT domain-containing protein [Acidobacteriota bacterium]